METYSTSNGSIVKQCDWFGFEDIEDCVDDFNKKNNNLFKYNDGNLKFKYLYIK